MPSDITEREAFGRSSVGPFDPCVSLTFLGAICAIQQWFPANEHSLPTVEWKVLGHMFELASAFAL